MLARSSLLEKDDLLAVKFTDSKEVYLLTTILDDLCRTLPICHREGLVHMDWHTKNDQMYAERRRTCQNG